MICLDSNTVIDYLNGDEGVRPFFEQYLPRVEEKVGIPNLVQFEVYVGEIYVGGPDADGAAAQAAIDAVDERMPWAVCLGLDAVAIRIAARIRAASLRDAEEIGALDALLAGIARRHDATLATADSDFDGIEGLTLVDPRRDDYEA